MEWFDPHIPRIDIPDSILLLTRGAPVMIMTNHIFHDAVVIRLHGDFDYSGSEVLEKSIRLAHGLFNRMVIFNCTDVTSINGAGVGILCFALHTLVS